MKEVVAMQLPCPFCGQSNWEQVLTGLEHHYKDEGGDRVWRYDLIRCRGCGMARMDPLPALGILQTFYPRSYGCYAQSAQAKSEASSWKYRLAGWRGRQGWAPLAAAKRSAAVLAEIVTGRRFTFPISVPLALPKQARILDVGYGSGIWLLIMAELGYTDLHGYDIDANQENRAELAAAGVNLSAGDFLKNPYEPASFDCIRLQHVFEHLTNPLEVLRRCRELIRPGGILVMGFPSIQSLAFRQFGRHYACLDLPRHLFHHSPLSARAALEKSGWTIERFDHFPIAEAFADSGRRSSPGFLFGQPGLLRLVSPLYNLWSKARGCGEGIMVVARPGGSESAHGRQG